MYKMEKKKQKKPKKQSNTFHTAFPKGYNVSMAQKISNPINESLFNRKHPPLSRSRIKTHTPSDSITAGFKGQTVQAAH